MILYAESSAVLSWLLSETPGETVRQVLAGAELVFSSDVTLIECDRVLIRALGMGRLSEAKLASVRAALNRAAEHWALISLDRHIVERARLPFPNEPVRTLDAIHLASALFARSVEPQLDLLSLDARVRGVGTSLGFACVPDIR